MHDVLYHTRADGTEPVSVWLNELQKHNRSDYFRILAKIDKLRLEGFKLLGTEMMRSIKGLDDVYELRTGKCRVLVYYDVVAEVFILLHGFLKKHRTEEREILVASSLISEYLIFNYGGK